jgi:hypothetical protein
MSDSTAVFFGNPNPQMQVKQADGSVHSIDAPHLEQTVTRFDMQSAVLDPEFVELTLSTRNERHLSVLADSLPDEHKDFAVAVHQCESMLERHTAGVAPTWVSCPDNVELQAALAQHFDCLEGEPVAVLTNEGRDHMHEQHLKSSGQPVGHEWGALSATATEPGATDTTLQEEITTASGGLIRKKMGFAHSAGTNTSTLTETWTANASDTLPVTIKRWANFNLAKQSEGSGKGIGESDKLSSSATLSAIGDSITVTFTLTAG